MSYTDNNNHISSHQKKLWSDITNEIDKSMTSTIQIRNYVIQDHVEFYAFSKPVSFFDCYFLKDIVFRGIHPKYVNFFNCCFDESLSVYASFSSDFTLDTVSCKQDISIFRGTYESCNWSFADCSDITIIGGHFNKLYISTKNKEIDNLSLRSNIEGDINIVNAKIEKIDVSGLNEKSNLSIFDSNINVVNFKNYRNDGKLNISNVTRLKNNKPSMFYVDKSYLGKAEFYNIDFNQYDVVNFDDTSLVDCIFVNIIWKPLITAGFEYYIFPTTDKKERELFTWVNKNVNNFLSPHTEFRTEKSRILYFRKSREVYRQLKYALSKQGDVINEQYFHSKEMIVYKKSLLWFSRDFGTKLIISLSQWTSNFGQSIFLPIFWLLIGHLILCTLAWLYSAITVASIGDYVNAYLILINPLHSYNIPSENWGTYEISFKGALVLIDIAMRIWSSYMIYNIIRASRRFIK